MFKLSASRLITKENIYMTIVTLKKFQDEIENNHSAELLTNKSYCAHVEEKNFWKNFGETNKNRRHLEVGTQSCIVANKHGIPYLLINHSKYLFVPALKAFLQSSLLLCRNNKARVVVPKNLKTEHRICVFPENLITRPREWSEQVLPMCVTVDFENVTDHSMLHKALSSHCKIECFPLLLFHQLKILPE